MPLRWCDELVDLVLRLRSWSDRLLPRFDGVRRDLPLNQIAPAEFEIRPARRRRPLTDR